MTKLVFETLRVGFPTFPVKVFLNSLCGQALEEVQAICDANNYETQSIDTIHHKWIEYLCLNQTNPFYVVDTDIIFYENFENNWLVGAMAGWRIPEWNDEFTGCITRARLHGSLLYINPVEVRKRITEYEKSFPNSEFVPKVNLFHPICLPFKGKGYFYDTCGLLYHAIGGTSFTDKQLDSYFHFNFGTISDIVLPRLPFAKEMEQARKFIMSNKQSGRGAWRQQMEYYAARQP